MLNGRTELHILDRGSVTGDRYYDEVLLLHVRLFRGVIGPDFIFMADNARPHRTLAVEELLENEDITRMDWPVYSPDLSPIEHVWNTLGRRFAACLHHPENTQQLKQMLIEEWALLPQEILHQLVLSMQRCGDAHDDVHDGDHDDDDVHGGDRGDDDAHGGDGVRDDDGDHGDGGDDDRGGDDVHDGDGVRDGGGDHGDDHDGDDDHGDGRGDDDVLLLHRRGVSRGS
ncbi:transposable element Tcb1 transposase [Trichonephila clavipes]|uniref:Transposable element Tcb1 transposase n=1 Tax=Trichonephila clavipes TaxID=2585209 RepID=A0A8X6RZ83_TRICX|nr:transposable element Tcb1 transposase [Trichonephila clavipes]